MRWVWPEVAVLLGPTIPTPVGGVTGAPRITAGPYDSCALATGGAIKGWGSNTHRQAGEGNGPTNAGVFDVVTRGPGAP